jgi:di/tricarboxylate transporter
MTIQRQGLKRKEINSCFRTSLLMPLSFAPSLGTTITIIGAPAFLIPDTLLQQAGRPRLGIFSIAPIGLSLSLVGTLFILLLVGRFLLPARKGGQQGVDRFCLDDYFTELTILPTSPFLGKTIDEVKGDSRYQFRVVGWLRNGRRLPRPFGERRLSTKGPCSRRWLSPWRRHWAGHRNLTRSRWL